MKFIARTEILRRRLASQYLTTPGPKTGADVVRALGAVQAQDYAGAKWALGQRTRNATDAGIERELGDGSILRTHVLRPTWHFVAPADIRWMLALTAPRVKAAMAYHDRVFGVTPTIYRRGLAALTKALAGGKHLARAEVVKTLERAGVKTTSGQRVGLMMRAELDAVICSGPRSGKQATYALLDERVPSALVPERDEALLELTRRYFRTRGPATRRDFAWWSGLSVADAKRGIQVAERDLEQVSFDGEELYFTERALPRAEPSAHLLPNYDEYFIGYKDRSAIAARVGHAKHVTAGNWLTTHVVFVDGQLVGGWKRVIEKDTAVVELDLESRLTAPERRRVVAEARRFGTFLGVTVILRG